MACPLKRSEVSRALIESTATAVGASVGGLFVVVTLGSTLADAGYRPLLLGVCMGVFRFLLLFLRSRSGNGRPSPSPKGTRDFLAEIGIADGREAASISGMGGVRRKRVQLRVRHVVAWLIGPALALTCAWRLQLDVVLAYLAVLFAFVLLAFVTHWDLVVWGEPEPGASSSADTTSDSQYPDSKKEE